MISRDEFVLTLNHLNEEQLDAVFCDRNCVVAAGAGSGKTMVLAYRFVRLIVEKKAHADEILTLTFTRLAAAEMYERIHAYLSSYADDPDIANELKRFNEATITTIDAFCHQIVASDPMRYGIGADFTLDEEMNREIARECAIEALEAERGQSGVTFLSSVYSPDDLIDAFLVPLATAFFYPCESFDAAWMADQVKKRLYAVYTSRLETCLIACEGIVSLQGTGKSFEAVTEVARMMLAQRQSLVELANPDDTFLFLDQLSMPKCRGKGDYVSLCNAYVDTWRQAFDVLCASCSALTEQQAIDASYSFLAAYQQRYLERKRQRSVLTFSDVAHMAIDILRHNPLVCTYYRHKFRHIMVDEFQDTNTLQKDLLYLLAARGDPIDTNGELESEKLFFVGDEKQSIYRFRGADVRVFKQLSHNIVTTGGRLIALDKNYRSEPALIDFWNEVFPSIMQNSGALYEADFQKLCASKATSSLVSSILFYFKPLNENDASTFLEDEEDEESVDAVQAEAHALALLIQKMVSTDHYHIIDEHGNERRPTYRDIAILYRTASNQLHYEKALRLAGIPYTLSAAQSLFLEAPANDIYHMLQLVLFPTDRMAFVALLRSPFCRLSDDAIIDVLDSREQKGQVFPDVSGIPLSDVNRRRYDSICSLYGRLCDLATHSSITELLTFLWYEGGYRYHLLSDRSYQVYLEHVDFLFDLCRRFDKQGKGLSFFLDYLRPRLGQNARLEDIEPLRDTFDGVRMMTIHKSKGLEFPIVIIADMGSMAKQQKTPPWHVVETQEGNLIVPFHMHPCRNIRNVLYEVDKDQLQAMEAAEMKRLLYVAMTRAKAHLVLSGCQNKRNMGNQNEGKNLLALFVRTTGILNEDSFLRTYVNVHMIPDAPASVLRSVVPFTEVAQTVATMRPYYEGEPRGEWIACPRSYSVTELVPVPQEKPGPILSLPSLASDELVVSYDLAAPFGTWCHAIIARTIASLSPPFEPSGAILLADPLQCMPKGLPLGEQEIVLLAQFAQELASNFFTSELFTSLCRMHPVAMESEVPFAYRHYVDGRAAAVYGSIDLLVRYETEIRIVDFKTDTVKNPAVHAEQLSMYRQAAWHLFGLPVRSTVCYLRSVGNETWSEATD